MAITYDPSDLLKEIAPESKIKKLLTKDVTLKKTALSFVDAVKFIDKSAVARVALKTVKSYQQRIADAQIEAGFESDAGNKVESEIVDDPKQLIQRVQNEVIFQISGLIREKHSGKTYTWLPSSAEEPDPEHQLNYGKSFVIGDGEMPGDRYGCLCGMEIDTKETELNIE